MARDLAPATVEESLSVAEFQTNYGAPEKAVEVMRQAEQELRNTPGTDENRERLAQACWRCGDWHFHRSEMDAAVEWLVRAIDLKPDHSQALDHRGDVFLRRGEWQLAADDLDASVRAGAAYAPGTYARRAVANCRLGRLDRARADLEQLAACDGCNEWFWAVRVALLLDDQIRYRELCMAMLQRFADTTNPDEANTAAWTTALAPGALEDYAPALRLARRTRELARDNDQFRTVRAAVLLRAGQTDTALEQFTAIAALEQQSFLSRIYVPYFLAIAHARLGHAAEASSSLVEADRRVQEQGGLQISTPLLHREVEALLTAIETNSEEKHVGNPPERQGRRIKKSTELIENPAVYGNSRPLTLYDLPFGLTSTAVFLRKRLFSCGF